MKNTEIYNSIKARSNGDIYLGVVGPVRTGKSTFITKFMQKLIVPNIMGEHAKNRATTELPQSADGLTVMTTEPKFVPNEAVEVSVDKVKMNVRMVDCVGYLVTGALGLSENGKERLVKTPWSEKKVPFKEAAETGTKKVIEEHSTVGIMVTTDGSITDLNRKDYEKAEEEVVEELKKAKKPFVIVLNSKTPTAPATLTLKEALQTKYDTPVIAMDVLNIKLSDINDMLEKLLMEFPAISIDVKMPKWMEALPYLNSFVQEIINEIKNMVTKKDKMGDYMGEHKMFANSEHFEMLEDFEIEMDKGKICFTVKPKPDLYYKVLSDQTGMEITNDYQLVSYLKQLTHAKEEYDKIKVALDGVKEHGYGVVTPKMEEMILAEPELIKRGGQYGVKLKASAPSLHLMRVDIETEVSPIVGTEQQGEELVKSLLSNFESDPKALWETKMFGKSLHMLVNEGLNHKINAMPMEAQAKMRKTLGRIVNEGKGGIICILL